MSEDRAGVGVDLREGDGAPSCSGESDVETADTGEEGGVGEGWKRMSPFLVLNVSDRSSDNSGPFPPPGFPSRMRSNVGRIHDAARSKISTAFLIQR